MKKRMKGLITLWLALALVCSVMTVPAFAAETTNAYYYTGAHALEPGLLVTEADGITIGNPSTTNFQYGDGAATIIAQVGSASANQIGWKVWAAEMASGGFDIDEAYVVKKLEDSVTKDDYDSIISWYNTLAIEEITIETMVYDLELTPAASTAANIIYGATLSVNTTGYELPDHIFVYSHGTALSESTDYTYNSTTGVIEIKTSGVTGDVILIANGKIRHKEFRMGGNNNTMLQWRYEGDAEWNDITAVQSGTSITLGANGNLYVNGMDTNIKVNYASDISEINTKITNLTNSLGGKADASVLNTILGGVDASTINLKTLSDTLAGKADITALNAVKAELEELTKAGGVIDKIEDRLDALEREKEFRMNGAMLQWRYEGETTWNDVVEINSATSITLGANGNLYVNGTDTNIKVNYAGDISTLNTTITNLQNSLGGKADASALNELKETVEGIQTTVNTLNNLTSTVGTHTTNITNLTNTVNELKTAVNKITDIENRLEALEREKEFRMNGAVLQWRYEGEATWNDVVAINDTTVIDISNGYLTVNGAATNVYIGDIAEINNKIANLQNSLSGKADATVLSNTVTELTKVQSTIETLKTTLAGKADNATVEALDAAYKAADKALEDAVKALTARVEALETSINGKADAAELKTAVTNLTTVIGDITNIKTTLEGKVSKTTVEALDAAYKAADKALEDAVKALTARVEKLETELKEVVNNKASAAELKTTVTNLTSAMNDITNIKKLLETNTANVTDLTVKAEKLDAAYKAADKALEDAVKALTARVEALESAIKNKAGVTELNTAVTNLTKAMEDITSLKAALELNTTNISALSTKIGTLEVTYKAADDALKTAIDAIEKRVAELEKDVKELEEKAEEKTAEIVTGIVSGVALVSNGATIAWIIIDRKKKLAP